MSRGQNNGLLYFSVDTDFFGDKSIKVLKARYGADGVVVYLYILCLIYKDGYYTTVDEDFCYVIAEDLNMDFNKIGQIINFLCDRSLLDGKLFTSDKVLTSHGIQLRYQLSMKSRRLSRDIFVERKYWVLKKEETEPFIKYIQKSGISTGNEEKPSRKEDKSSRNPPKRKEINKSNEINIIVAYLNEKAGTGYKPSTENTIKHITARIQEGYTIDDFKTVIDKKCTEWLGTEFEKFLRPATLFGTKFESYLNGKTSTQKKTSKNRFANFTERNNDYGDIEKRMIKEMEKLGG